jgi:hypothetical protein
VDAFDAYLNGTDASEQLTRVLRRTAPGGITEGSYFVPAGYLTLPVLQ